MTLLVENAVGRVADISCSPPLEELDALGSDREQDEGGSHNANRTGTQARPQHAEAVRPGEVLEGRPGAAVLRRLVEVHVSLHYPAPVAASRAYPLPGFFRPRVHACSMCCPRQ